MKNSLRTIVMWLIIGIVCIILISAITENAETKIDDNLLFQLLYKQ